jgi:hypothetical protein
MSQKAAMAPRTPKSSDEKPVKAAKSAKLRVENSVAEKPVTATPNGADQAKAGTLKLRDLVEAVATATGTRKPAAKTSVEAVLAALGDALKSGSVLVLPPLGKLRVAKTAGTTLTLKLRLADAPKAGGKPLADDGEDS